ncbi:MAG: YfhO family protein [Acidimicrobiales bacterium]
MMGSFALVDVTDHRPVSQHRAAWRDHYPDLLAIGWVLAVSVGLFIPALVHGPFLGPQDLMLKWGITAQQTGGSIHAVPYDPIGIFMPWTVQSWQQIHSGHLPLWNPSNGLGMPLAFNWQSAPFGLPALVGYLLPLRYAYTVGVMVTVCVAGTGAYTFGRVLGLGTLASAMAGTVFALSGPLVQWVGWSAASVMSWSGWLFAAAILITRGRHRIRSICLFAAALAMSVYGGHPESSFILVVALCLYFAVVVIHRLFVDGDRSSALLSTADLVVAGAAGGALAAPLILPGVQLIELSARRTNTTLAVLPPHGLAYYLFNGFDGLGVGTGNWFGSFPGGAVTDYVGAIALALLVVAVSARWRRPEVMALGAVTVVMVGAVFVPSFASVLHRIPFFGSAQLIRAEMPVAFALAMLAGIGLDVLVRRNTCTRVQLRALASFGLIAVVLLAAWLFARGQLTSTEERIRASSFLWPAVETAIGLLVVGGIILLDRRDAAGQGRAGQGRAGIHRSAVRLAAGSLLVAEAAFLIASGAPVWTSSMRFFPVTPAVAALKRDVGTSLVGTGVTSCPSALLFPNLPSLGFLGETNIVYGVRYLSVYDGVVPASDFRAWTRATGRSAGELGNDYFCPVVHTVSAARLFGISYLLESRGVDAPAGSTFVARVGNEDLFHVPGASEATLSPLSPAGAIPAAKAAFGTPVPVRHPNPSTWQIETSASTSRVLRLRLNDLPGWHASIDGRPLALTSFAGAMLQARIPAGQHRVVLTYWPRAFTVGLLLALVSAASLVGAGAIAWMSARRKLRP